MARSQSTTSTSNRGFASMSSRKKRQIASMGGRASHGGRGRDYESRSPRASAKKAKSKRSGTSRRGFAAMSPQERRAIASMGGKASHGGRGRDYVSQKSTRSDGYKTRARASGGGKRRGRSSSSTSSSRRGYSSTGRGSHRSESRPTASMSGRRGSASGRGGMSLQRQVHNERNYDQNDFGRSSRSSRDEEYDNYDDQYHPSANSTDFDESPGFENDDANEDNDWH